MEKIAIISDIHANITALDAVLNDIKKRNIKRIFCLGDLVTKSVNPDLVIDKIKENCEIVIKGNSDESTSKADLSLPKFWTARKIGKERCEYLASLPISFDFYMSGHLIRLFHASPYSLSHLYNPMFSNKNTKYSGVELECAEDLFKNTSFLGKTESDPIPDIIGYGHIHTPNIFRYKNKTIFNPGSVGMPTEMLNNNPNDNSNTFSTLSSYIILEGDYNSKELSSISINIIRVPYNIDAEIKNVQASDISTKEQIIKNLKTAMPM